MKKRTKAAIVFIVGFIILILLIFTVNGIVVSNKYSTSLENSYAKSLGDLTERLSEMDSSLEKLSYAGTSSVQSSVVMGLVSASGGAKIAMSYLPFSDSNSDKVERIISVTEDYACYIGRVISTGGEVSDEIRENFKKIKENISALYQSMSSIRSSLGENNLKIGKTERLLEETLNIPEPTNFDADLEGIGEQLDSFPTLLYDGPFSEHITNMEAVFIKDKEEINKEDAIDKACEFFDVDKNDLTCENTTDGALSSFEIRGENVSINVTRLGGEVVWAKKSGDIESAELNYDEALEKAKEFLEKAGLSNMKESYYVINDNICTINFNAVQNEVLLYPDLVKISIELNEGGVVEYSAEGYLMNHKEREIPAPVLTEDEALSKVLKSMTTNKVNMAIIPTNGKNEVFCYEISCTDSEGNEILIYINAETGFEEKIYILDRSDTGVMAR